MKSNQFFFSIIDDTDDSTLENIRPIYEFLYEKGIFITKTVWIFPPKDLHSKGDSLQRSEYMEYIRELNKKGFEIAIHNIGSGPYLRNKIILGLEEFKSKLGFYPKIHINHAYNNDSIYGGHKRFNWPLNLIVKRFYPQYSGIFQGDDPRSEFFWGDMHKKIIKFNRNHEFSGINTLKYDKYMPYIDPKRNEYSNYWFSATFAPNPIIFKRIVNDKTIKKLEEENGICILFTHLGYFMNEGKIDPGFIEGIDCLSRNKNGKYLPVTDVLNFISAERFKRGKEKYPVLPRRVKFRMELQHLFTRYKYRKLVKIDDYTFKKLNKEMFV